MNELIKGGDIVIMNELILLLNYLSLPANAMIACSSAN